MDKIRDRTKSGTKATARAMALAMALREQPSSAPCAVTASRRGRWRERFRIVLPGQEGATLIEVAVAMILITVVFFGIFEFSMALTSYCSATYAVRAGARYASLHSATSLSPAAVTDIQAMVNSTLFMPGATGQSVTVTYTVSLGAAQGNYAGNIVGVTLKWTQRVTIPGYTTTFPVQSQMFRTVTR